MRLPGISACPPAASRRARLVASGPPRSRLGLGQVAAEDLSEGRQGL